VSTAREQAASAADRSRVSLRVVTGLGELSAVVALFDEVWANTGPPVVGVEHLRALAYTGGYVAAAFDEEAMLAASVGFFSAPPGRALHSDVTGVRAAARGRQLGFALKLHQRAWAMGLGIEKITWTFDPLLSRNAHFNLARLRATATRYEQDFYGDMPDGINVGQGSDRLLASWPLASGDVVAACDRSPPPETAPPDVPALLSEVDGRPVVRRVDDSTALVRVAVPADIEALRREDPGLGRAWRLAVRSTLGAEMSGGARVVGFQRAAGYLVDRGGAHADRGR
jgi:predicted GNAT superfamily acetyltransferase